jgi:hypothetical protein
MGQHNMQVCAVRRNQLFGLAATPTMLPAAIALNPDRVMLSDV